jgi:hypothetical protein
MKEKVMRRKQAWTPATDGSSVRTSSRVKHRAAVAALWFVALGLVVTGSARAQIHVSFSPSDTTVTQGSDFWITINATSASAGYDGFDSELDYNTSALKFISTDPQAAVLGCLFSGGCADALGNRACGQNVVFLTPSADSVYACAVLNCGSNVWVTAPGSVFRLHFLATGASPATQIHFRNVRFSTASTIIAGSYSVTPTIHINGTTDVGPTASGLRLSSSPNPASRAVSFAITSDNSGDQELSVHDIQGRAVRVLARGWQPAGSRVQTWDGTDESGQRVRPGVYLVTFRMGTRRILDRVTILE